eukprot:g1451.t1
MTHRDLHAEKSVPLATNEKRLHDVTMTFARSRDENSKTEAVRKTQFAPRIESVQEYHVSKVQPSNKDAVKFDADASDEEDAKQKYRKTGIVPNRGGTGSKDSDAADDPDVTFDVPDDWTEEDKVQYRKTGRVPPGRQLTSLASSAGRTSDGSAGGDRASTSSGAEKRVASALKTPGDNEQSNKGANRQPRETRFAQQIATVKEIPGNGKGKAKDKKAVGFDEDKKAGDDEGTTQSMKYRKTGALLPADSRASFSSVDEDDDEEEEEGHKSSQDSRGTDDAVDGAALSARDKKKAVQIAPDADAPDVDVKKFRKTGFVKPGATPADEDSDDETSSEDEAELGAIMQGGATSSPGSQPRTRATRFAESPPSVREIAGRGQDGDDKKVGFGGDVVDDDEQKQRFRKTGIAPKRGSGSADGSDDDGESDVSFDPAIGDNDDAKQKYRKTGFVPKGGAFDADVSFDPAIGDADHEIREKYRKTGVPGKRKPGLVEQEEDDDEDTPKEVSFDPTVDNETGTREKFRKTGFPRKQGNTKKNDETSPSEDDDEVDEDVGDTSPAGDAPSRTKAKPKSQVNFPEDQTAGAKSEDQPGKLYRRTAMPTTDRDSRMSDDSAGGSRAAGSDSGAASVKKSDSSSSAAPSTGAGTDDANSGEKLITGVVLSELDEAVKLDSADSPGQNKKRGVGFADMDDDDDGTKATLRKTAFPKPKTFSKAAGSSNKAVGFGGVSVKPVSVFDEDSRMTEQASLRIGSPDLASGASTPETTNKASEEEAGLAQIEANPFEVPLHKQEDEHDKGKLLLDLIHEELANDGENTGGKSKSKGKDDKEGDEDSYEAYLKRRHEANKEYYGVEDVGVDREHTSVRLSLLDDAGTPELGSADEETIAKAEAGGTALATTSAHTTKYSRDYTPLPDIPDGKPEYDPNAFPELQDMNVEFYKRQSYFRDVNVDALHGEDSYGERRSHLEELGEHIATMHRQTGTGHVPIKIVANAMSALSSYFGFGGGSAAADIDDSSADKVNNKEAPDMAVAGAGAALIPKADDSSAAVVQISGPRSDAAREMLVNRVLADAEHDMDSSASPPSASTAPNAGVPLWAAPVLMPSQQSPGSRSRSLGPGNKRPSSSSGKWSWPDPRGQSTLMMGLQMKARPDPQAFRASWNWADPRGQSTLRDYGTAWSGWPDRTSNALRDSQAVRASWNWPDPRGRSTLRDAEQRGSVSSSDPSSGGGPSSPSPTDSPPASRGLGLKAATFYEPARSRLGSFSEVMGASNINGTSPGGGEHLMSGEHRGYSRNVLMEQADIGEKASFSSGETSQIRKALEDSLLVMEKQGERLEEKLEACADDLKVELVENTAVLKQSLAIEAGALAERLAADVSEWPMMGAMKSGDAPHLLHLGPGDAPEMQKMRGSRKNLPLQCGIKLDGHQEVQIARDEINGQLSLITEGLDPDDPAVAQMEERVASLQRQIAETKKQDRKREANFVLDSLRRDARRLNGKVNVDVNVLNRTSRGQPTGAELQLKNALTYRPVHQGRSCIWGSDLAPDCDMMDVVSPAASSTSSSTSTNKNSSCGATGASATCGASSMFPTLHQTVGMANVASSNASSATATPAPSPVPLACFPPVTAQKRTHACRELFEQGQPTESGMKRMKIDTSAPVAELKQLFGGNNTNSDTNTSSVFTTFGKFQERPDGSFPGYIGSGFMSR